jgi:hypothetical protein
MKALHTILLCLLLMVQTAFAQVPVRWQAGPEVGYAVTDFPWKRDDRGINSQRVETLIPKFNPMLGMRGTMLLGKHWLFGASLQYQLSGYIYRFQQEFIHDNYTVTYETFHSQRYHKIALPLSLTYRFKIGTVHPFVGFGYRAAWMNHLRGRGYYQRVSPDSSSLNTSISYDYQNFHPWQRLKRRWLPQVMFTMGAEIGEHLSFTLNAAAGSFGIPTWVNFSDQYATYRNRELFATLSYRLW